MRWLLGLVAVAALAAAGWWLLRSRGDDTKQLAAARDAGSASPSSTGTTGSPPALADVTEKQEQGERALIEAFVTEQKLTPSEADKVLASLRVMQDGRRQLFIDLKARAITIEDVSARLRELRTQMKQRFELELGKSRSDQLIDRIRIAHGGEAKSDK